MWSVITDQITEKGAISFSEFQEVALYHPQTGFYSTRGAGRGADFLTSPEVGNLFGSVLAAALDKWWRHLGRPDPFYVIEGGAGSGTLAATILESEPRCLPALRYLLVERSASLRSEQHGRLSLSLPGTVLAGKPKEGSMRANRGPSFASLEDLPQGPLTGVVLANELLDNLPVDLYEKRGRHWFEVCVTLGKDGDFVETLVPLEDDDSAWPLLNELGISAPDGGRIPVQKQATAWLQRSLDLLDQGRVVVIDYMRTTRWMAKHDWTEWMRTYRGHRPGTSPFDSPGTQDITCEVAADQLVAIREPDRDRTQVEFLEAHGLVAMIADAREAWHTRAEIGDIGAVRARARVQEGRALTDVSGLGRFRVLEWVV